MTAQTASAGRYGINCDGGRALVDDILRREATTVTRRLARATPGLAAGATD
jgi:hypothetical protein